MIYLQIIITDKHDIYSTVILPGINMLINRIRINIY